jgi:TPR repeat protein
MKIQFTILCLTISVLLGSMGVSWSADFQKGLTAAQSGDFATAMREWTPLAEDGDVIAQYNLGVMHEKGRGILHDHKTAVKWYRLAAEQGHAKAQYNLGLLYDNGQGDLQDYKTAVKWYRLAAEQGHTKAHANLGLLYAKGEGVIQDNVFAYMWWNIAASSGDKAAVSNRDVVAGKMTSSQIAEAEKLTRECVRKKYKGC